jgi:hypothetical protein
MPDTELEVVSLSKLDTESKILLLHEIGYESDGIYVLKGGQRIRDKVTGEEVTLNRMAILPGSVLVISDNPLSIADYLEDYDETL